MGTLYCQCSKAIKMEKMAPMMMFLYCLCYCYAGKIFHPKKRYPLQVTNQDIYLLGQLILYNKSFPRLKCSQTKKISTMEHMAQFCGTHLSKGPSDLKQNGTQEREPFSGTVFHALSLFGTSYNTKIWPWMIWTCHDETKCQKIVSQVVIPFCVRQLVLLQDVTNGKKF